MSKLEKTFLVLTCLGAMAGAAVTMLEKWRAVPVPIARVAQSKPSRVCLQVGDEWMCSPWNPEAQP